MIQFGSSGIVAGYLKQLLATFNLPKMRVYTAEHEQYRETHDTESPYLMETTFPVYKYEDDSALAAFNEDQVSTGNQVTTRCYAPYIKEGLVQFYVGGYYAGYNKYIPGVWQSAPLDINKGYGGAWQTYERGEYYKNLTKTLEIKNNIYDSYTHEYLGDYLRFLRDFDGLDLMSMYNCFSNRRPYRLNYKDDFISLDTSDSDYKIYVVPVKLFKDYTIAIDSAYPVEVCCGLGQKDSIGERGILESELSEKTYQRFSSMRFGQPVLYTKLKDLAAQPLSEGAITTDIELHRNKRNLLAKLGSQEDQLTLYIKLNRYTESSIVILEGNYLNWNDFVVTKELLNKNTLTEALTIKPNRTVITNNAIFAPVDLKLIAPLQLLKFNSGTQVPFADRLLEYLFDQCVTGGVNETRENVLMAQYLAGLRNTGKAVSLVFPTPPDLSTYSPDGIKKVWKLGELSTGIEVQEGTEPSFVFNNGKWKLQIVNSNGEVLAESNEVESSGLKSKVRPDTLTYDLLNGVWTPSLRKLFYQYMSGRSDFASRSDILGYVDRDVEKLFVAKVTQKDGTKRTKTMLDFNAWEDIKE